MFKLIYILFPIIILLFMFAGCSESQKEVEQLSTKEPPAAKSQPVDSLVLTLAGQNNRSVFDLTTEKYEVEYIGSAMGAFVHSIDSIEINQNYGWQYSVNDSMGNVASDKYLTKNGDTVKWHYRKF